MRRRRRLGRRIVAPLTVAAVAVGGVAAVGADAVGWDGFSGDRGLSFSAVAAGGVSVLLPRAVPAARSGLPGVLRSVSIRVGGVERYYLLSIPPGLRRAGPLVVAFHGLFQAMGTFTRQSGLVAATRAHGEVLILPESQGVAFNDGRLGPRGPRDDAFTMALLDRYERGGLVDRGRVTVTGFSNGAGMAMEVASAHPRRIAAVVTVDGEMIRDPTAPRPTGPVEAILIHGTADRVQPWLGRRGRGRNLPPFVSVLTTVAAWVHTDRAGRAHTTGLRARLGARGRTDPVTRTVWAPGSAGAGVTFYRVQGMGHRWPVPPGAPVSRGDQQAALDATAIIVATAATTSRMGDHTRIG